jgi:hypothetical protein
VSLYVDADYVEAGYAQEGITILWAQKIIFVPKGETTLVQLTPTEIRSLDLNVFRLTLKALEATPDGIVWSDTHAHNGSVTVGGVTLAQVVEILNGYTVTFEDGDYAVNLFGANSNVADVTNVNHVSVRSANSAGLVTTGGANPLDIANAVWDLVAGIEATITPRQAVRIALAALAGKLSGAPGGPVAIRNVGDTKDRITATVDANGNRTAVTVDGL